MNSRTEQRGRDPHGNGFDVPDHVIGIDLGGTKIRAGIATFSGELLAEKRTDTSAAGSDVIEQIRSLALHLCDTIGITLDRVAATAVGGAGVPDKTGTTFDLAPNLTALGDIPFTEQLSAALGHLVVIENDVNVSAVGELVAGLGRGHSHFVFISVGTGIGMGIVVNGSLLRGSKGAAGEIGFLPLGGDPLDPANHVRGPLEEVTAGDAVSGRFLSSSGSALSPEEIFALAASGDQEAVEAVDEEARWLAAGIVAVNAVLAPELVVLGGGIGTRPDLLPRITSWLIHFGQPDLIIRVSELGHLAPVIGALTIAIEAAAAAQKGISR
jgi:glucokinase